jgi:hypothetical protein
MKNISTLLIVIAISFSTKAQSWNKIDVGAGDPELEAMCSDRLGNIYLGGYCTDGTGHMALLKFNGLTYSVLGGIPNDPSYLGQVLWTCSDTSNNIYAVGEFYDDSGNSFIAKWNGSTWSQITSGNDTLSIGGPLCTDNFGNLYTVGYGPLSTVGSTVIEHSNIYKWDGVSWTIVGGPTMGLNPNGGVNSICADKFGNLYAVGLIVDSSDTVSPTSYLGELCVEKWDGSSWSVLGGAGIAPYSPIGILSVICDTAGNVYAAGDTWHSSGDNVFKWNGTSWSVLGGASSHMLNANGPIWSLCTDKYGNIYAAGDFTDSTPVAQSNEYVAKWDGTSWSELGSGSGRLHPNGRIASIASDSYGNIYACGDLVTDAGEGFVGMYPNAATSVQQITQTDDVSVFPNPAHNTITIRINETKQSYGGTNYSLYDCTGRVYVSGKIDNSNTPVDISALPAGIYILQLDNNVNATFKIVKQ